MHTDIEERTVMVGNYIIDKKATVRAAAKHFGISKSTVHKDVTIRLRGINRALFDAVAEVLAENKSVRHLRGGQATKLKYAQKNSYKYTKS